MARWIEMCGNCVRHGVEHDLECTCRPANFVPSAAPVRPVLPEPDVFTLLQLERDALARRNNTIGDMCKRTVTCGYCAWTSPAHSFWDETDEEETYHMLSGCPTPTPARPEPDGTTWPYPEPWPFLHRIEPADEPDRESAAPKHYSFPVAGRRAPIVLHLPKRQEPSESEAA